MHSNKARQNTKKLKGRKATSKHIDTYFDMELLSGVEPLTSPLPRVCSNQLSYKSNTLTQPINLERVAGIEPASSAWKAEVLPLNYTRRVDSSD